ncbi:MAG TPA: carbamoyltransferase N-terminal domain-containing protein, partial [Longimicrobium sp.]
AKQFRWNPLFGDHHESHAASAFYPSPFEEAAILTMDGVGGAYRAAVLELAVTLAACSEAPTGTAAKSGIAADRVAPALDVTASSTVTVTSSGGYPLISWTAVPGATSYKVNLVTTWFYTTWRGDGARRSFRELKTTTTATSFLDTSRVYSGDIHCTRPADYPYGPNDTYTEIYEYEVVAQLASGISTQRAYAPVGECY